MKRGQYITNQYDKLIGQLRGHCIEWINAVDGRRATHNFIWDLAWDHLDNTIIDTVYLPVLDNNLHKQSSVKCIAR